MDRPPRNVSLPLFQKEKYSNGSVLGYDREGKEMEIDTYVWNWKRHEHEIGNAVVLPSSQGSAVDKDVLKRNIKKWRKYDLESSKQNALIRFSNVETQMVPGNPMVELYDKTWYSLSDLEDGEVANRGNFEKAIYISTLLIDSQGSLGQNYSTLFHLVRTKEAARKWLARMKFDEATFKVWMDLRYDFLSLGQCPQKREMRLEEDEDIQSELRGIEHLYASYPMNVILDDGDRERMAQSYAWLRSTVLFELMPKIIQKQLRRQDFSEVVFIDSLLTGNIWGPEWGNGLVLMRKSVLEKRNTFKRVVGCLFLLNHFLTYCIDYSESRIYFVDSFGDPWGYFSKDNLLSKFGVTPQEYVKKSIYCIAVMADIVKKSNIDNKKDLVPPIRKQIPYLKDNSSQEIFQNIINKDKKWKVIESTALHRVQYDKTSCAIFAAWMVQVFAHGLHQRLDLIYLPLHVIGSVNEKRRDAANCMNQIIPARRYLIVQHRKAIAARIDELAP